jgi:hypothetical protein
VNSLHSRVIYLDEDRLPIKNSFISFQQKSGNFSDTYERSDPIPEGTKYIRHQFLAKMNPKTTSHFLIDDVKITQVYPDKPLKNNFEIFGNSYTEPNYNVTVDYRDVQVNIKKGNALGPVVLKTLPLDISSDVVYKYILRIEANNTNSLSSAVVYSTQDVQKSSKYGVEDGVMIMDDQSHISAKVDLLKTADYRVAMLVKTCETCSSSMTIRAGDTTKQFMLGDTKTELKWLYFDAALRSGTTELTIYSEGDTEIDKLILYSDSKDQNINNLFSETESSYSAEILKHNTINPMKQEIEINATKPFIIRLQQPYHPLWTAYVNGEEHDPVPIYFDNSQYPTQNIVSTNYPAINGFLIEDTGKMLVTIEYKALKWLYAGVIISIVAFSALLICLIWQRRQITFKLLKRVADGYILFPRGTK